MNATVWIYLSLGIFGSFIFIILMVIFLCKKINQRKNQLDNEKQKLLDENFHVFSRDSNSKQNELEFFKLCAKKQVTTVKLSEKINKDNVEFEVQQKFIRPTMNPFGVIAKEIEENVICTNSVSNYDTTGFPRRRSSLPNLSQNIQICQADQEIWKLKNLDNEKVLDEIFNADFGSNLGYKVEILPASMEIDESVPEESSNNQCSIESSKHKSSIRKQQSIESQNLSIPCLFKLPEEIYSEDIPCAGLILAELDVQWPKVNCRSPVSKYATNCKFDQIILKIFIYDAYCILAQGFGQHHSRRGDSPSDFYIKARLTQETASSLGSKNQVVIGQTPMKRAFRSLAFKHCISLPVPLHWIDYDKSGGCLPLDLKLKIDLKESLMQPDQPGSWSHLFKSRNIIASTEINLNTQLWKFFQCKEILSIDCKDESAEQNFEETKIKSSLPNQNEQTRLIFAKPLIPRNRERTTVRLGSLTLAIQMRLDEFYLSMRLVKAEISSMPKGVKQIFARCTLMTNHSIIRSFDSDKSINLSFAEVQFPLDNLLTVSMKPDTSTCENFNSSLISSSGDDSCNMTINEMCLLIVLMAKIRPHSPSIPLGRCVLGGPSLAYGSGLKHWSHAYKKDKEFVRASHSLF